MLLERFVRYFAGALGLSTETPAGFQAGGLSLVAGALAVAYAKFAGLFGQHAVLGQTAIEALLVFSVVAIPVALLRSLIARPTLIRFGRNVVLAAVAAFAAIFISDKGMEIGAIPADSQVAIGILKAAGVSRYTSSGPARLLTSTPFFRNPALDDFGNKPLGYLAQDETVCIEWIVPTGPGAYVSLRLPAGNPSGTRRVFIHYLQGTIVMIQSGEPGSDACLVAAS